MTETSRDRQQEENIGDPLVLIQVDKVEREEGVGEDEEHKHPVLIHRLAEGVAHTEGNACHDELEDRDLEQDCVRIARPVCCSVLWVNRCSLIEGVIFCPKEDWELDAQLYCCRTKHRNYSRDT